eukprot:415115_1
MKHVIMEYVLVMVWVYNCGVRSEDISGRDYIYVSTPMTIESAESYCLSTYNKHLATIITELDMVNAISTVNGSDSPWIGLHSVNKIGWFEYFDNVNCPVYSMPYGACLSKEFWLEGKPRQCGSELHCASDCITLYTQYDGHGKINNDIECETLQSFLCDAPDPTRQYIDTGHIGTWDEAYNYCLNHGGLASFVTEDDLKNLEEIVDATGSEFAWIGLVQRSNEQNNDEDWYWLDNTECTVTTDLCTDLWSPGEPNGVPNHVRCECKSYGCIRSGCIETGCVSYSECANRCINRDCSSEGKLEGQPKCECLEWKYECLCRQYGCIRTGCLATGCVDSECYSEDADCAGVQSSSGLTADYHCNANTAPIICNEIDESITNSAKIVSNHYLLGDLNHLIEPENVNKISIWAFLNNHDFAKYIYMVFVLLAISCMINIWCCFHSGCFRHKMSKIEYESVDMEEIGNVDIDK